jgi:hypothetical protein
VTYHHCLVVPEYSPDNFNTACSKALIEGTSTSNFHETGRKVPSIEEFQHLNELIDDTWNISSHVINMTQLTTLSTIHLPDFAHNSSAHAD